MTPPAAVLWDAWRLDGEEEAFSSLVGPHLPALHDLARRVGLADAEDAVQDALVELAGHTSPRPAEVGVAAWLMRSVRLRAKTLRRGSARRARHERAAARRDVTVGARRAVGAREEVEQALADLQPDDRLVLLLRFVYDLDYPEVGHVLGISQGACRVRVHRATARVRERLGHNALVLVGALPLDSPAHASSLIAVAVGGSLGMAASTKIALGVVAAALACTGAWWGISSATPHAAESRPPQPIAHASVPDVPAPPTLAGRVADTPNPVPAAESPPPVVPPVVAPPLPTPPRVVLDTRMALLIEEIKRNAAPDFWLDPPEPAALEARKGILIARAPSDVLDAIGAFLAARGQAALGETPATEPPPSPGDAHAVNALRTHARTLLARDMALRRAIEALEAERTPEALALLAKLLEDEPDHVVAAAVHKHIVEDPTRSRRIGEGVRKTAFWRQAGRFDAWLRAWPSPSAGATAERIVTPTAIAELAPRGDALEDLLERGHLTLEWDGGTLYEVLREIQIQTFIEIDLGGQGAWHDGGRRVAAFVIVGGSLREVLDRVFQSVVEETRLRWTVNPRCVRLTYEGSEAPEMRLRYFDVRHLLDPDVPPPPPPPPPSQGPPMPPTYQSPAGPQPVPVLVPR